MTCRRVGEGWGAWRANGWGDVPARLGGGAVGVCDGLVGLARGRHGRSAAVGQHESWPSRHDPSAQVQRAICCLAGLWTFLPSPPPQALLDDHIVKAQSMRASPYIKPIEAAAAEWERLLLAAQVLE